MSDTVTLAPVPPRATGRLETYEWKDGRTVSFFGRVRAYGDRYRIDFGTNLQGWNEERARGELERIAGQVARGTWTPPEPEAAEARQDRGETVHVTASRWWQRRRGELRPNTRADYEWRLGHMLRHLATVPTAELDARAVDELRAKLQRARLSARSTNMVLDLLAQVLDDAVDYDLLPANPARGRRRRVKLPKSRRSFLEPDMVVDLLDVAGEWEAELPVHQRYGRRALLAVLVLAGPRISELTLAPRGDLDVHAGRLRVADSKTTAGLRDIELTATALGELRAHLAGVPAELRDRGAGLPIFPTRTGGRLNASNVRNRLLTETVRRANERRARDGRMLLPERVTPHTLRRTFATLALTAGRDPRWVMAQIGHEDARLTLSLYAQVIQRRAVDYELVWSLMRFADERERWADSSGPRTGPTPEAAPAGAPEQPLR